MDAIKVEAKSLGCLARMNCADRVPIKDKKLMELIREYSTAQMFIYMKEWLCGWDEINIEYANARLETIKLLSENN